MFEYVAAAVALVAVTVVNFAILVWIVALIIAVVHALNGDCRIDPLLIPGTHSCGE